MGATGGRGDGSDETADERARREMPATVPERRRMDATVVVPSPIVDLATKGAAHASLSDIPGVAPDSYQPPPLGRTAGLSHPPTLREVIVPTTSTVDSILYEIRKSPAERVEVQARAASGGMGTIDVAVDRALDRRVALKSLHSHLRTSESAVRMFLREARLTGLLDHPHIVPVYDIGEGPDDRLYFSMKLVEGQTLSDVIRALPRGALDTAALYGLLDVVTKVCDAVAFAHSRGVLHCDIKPANVMVGEFGQVYVMDWGIARLVASEGSPGSTPPGDLRDPRPALASSTDNSVIGTPCYMSPEQARGDRAKLDARSDVFLIGSLLYEIITRRPPYESADRSETLSLAAAGSFPAPRKIAKAQQIPPELERIILRAMARSPNDRYPTVASLHEDLVRFMRGGGDFPRRSFSVGETIIAEGEHGDAAFIIIEGRCEVRKQLPDSPEVINVLGAGDVFGEMAILTEARRNASVVAVEPTTVLVVTSAVLEQEMAALKPWMATLLKSLATRFRQIDTKHRATYAAAPSPARLANQILMIVAMWGEVSGSAASMSWSDLAAELEAQLGAPPLAIFGVASRYAFELDVENDRLRIEDLPALRARIARDLGQAATSKAADPSR